MTGKVLPFKLPNSRNRTVSEPMPAPKGRVSAIDQLIENWAKSKDPKFYGHASAVRAQGDKLYSYAECIASLENVSYTAMVSETHYSVTTTKHERKAQIALEMAGYRVTKVTNFLKG